MAASKKDFAGMNTGRVYAAIETGTSRKGQQGTASPQEAKERRETLRTQGRKGASATRINMAFSDSNHQFVKVMAKATGRTMTEFVNLIIEAYRKEHPEMMEQAQGFLQVVNSGLFFADKEEDGDE